MVGKTCESEGRRARRLRSVVRRPNITISGFKTVHLASDAYRPFFFMGCQCCAMDVSQLQMGIERASEYLVVGSKTRALTYCDRRTPSFSLSPDPKQIDLHRYSVRSSCHADLPNWVVQPSLTFSSLRIVMINRLVLGSHCSFSKYRQSRCPVSIHRIVDSSHELVGRWDHVFIRSW